ncbi:MAG: cell division protein FtsB [Gammaproteobacteria bacterium]|nr:MAG: cell division protein FtsB [Gammaproteobacteria bacterium]
MAGRLLILSLFILLGLLQYKLWRTNDGVPALWVMEQKLEQLEQEKEKLRERNLALEAEVNNLKESMDAIEERARQDLGMIKKGETFFQVVE